MRYLLTSYEIKSVRIVDEWDWEEKKGKTKTKQKKKKKEISIV